MRRAHGKYAWEVPIQSAHAKCPWQRDYHRDYHNNTQAETGVQYTQNQWKAIRRIWEELEEAEMPADKSIQAKDQDPDVTNALMCLCMLVIMQDTSRISTYDAPMMHYLAVRGVDTQSRALRASF